MLKNSWLGHNDLAYTISVIQDGEPMTIVSNLHHCNCSSILTVLEVVVLEKFPPTFQA